jgi:cation diffusion facilitator CzcD-associated flavoprotein CzcO
VAGQGTEREEYDAVVVGAGFAGIYMLHRLRGQGLNVRLYERGDGVGGTWYWNRYPGARCDSESMYYSFSFLEELEQEWHWSERYPGQPEILNYLNTVTDRLDLRRDMVLSTAVTAASYSEDANRWLVDTDTDVHLSTKYLISAVGCLSTANRPTLPGEQSFVGETYHTGAWPHDGVSFVGKRVAIIGTGASGIQAIPEIAQTAEHLTVFQRTPNFTIPAENRPMDPEFEAEWKANYREWREKGRVSRAGIPYDASDKLVLEATDEDRLETFEQAWGRGGFVFTFGTYGDLVMNMEANEVVADFVRGKIDSIVKDPEVATKLKPYGYPFGTKRLPLDTNYFETFNRENVSLVDIRAEPISTVTPDGIRTIEGDYQADIIVFATGFDAMTGPLFNIDIQGKGGVKLKDKWSAGPYTYLGVSTAGFPNLFLITGPGSPSVLSNMPVSIEQHVEWIGDCIDHLRHGEHDTIEASEQAEQEWTAHVNHIASKTLYPKAASWYMGANIPGKPRVFMPYIGGVGNYRKKCNEVAAHGYEGFDLTTSS